METALVSDGAQRKPGSKLVDGNCDITIQIQRPSGACYSSLFVDVPNAKYRWISNTRTTKMCDFAVLVRRNNSAKLVLLELKAGMVWAGVLSFPHPVMKRPTETDNDYADPNSPTIRPGRTLRGSRCRSRFNSMSSQLTGRYPNPVGPVSVSQIGPGRRGRRVLSALSRNRRRWRERLV